MVIRCLLYMYTNQYLNIKWNSYMSKYFSTTNGVKQGGVLSPILFGVYIDELLCRLRKSGYGCKIGHLYFGGVGYADDVSFIAPSLYALNKMCKIALEYANEYDIKFNPLKCQFIYYGNSDNVVLNFDDVCLHPIKKGIHLGHIIGPDVDENVILDASYTLTRNVNFILANFKNCSYDVKFKLFNSYCTSFYGCPLWNLSCKYMSRFFIAWRKSVRRLFDLPYRTHCELLPIIADCQHIETQLLCRLSKFVSKSLSSHNDYLSLLMSIATNGSRSILSNSFNLILAKSNLSRGMFKTHTLSQLLKYVCNINAPTESNYQTGVFARSVVYDRECPTFLSVDNLSEILNVICTE